MEPPHNYSLFKCKAESEAYLTNYLPRQQRSLLAQIRLGILPLSIETGRFQNKKVEQRICPLCSKCIETELYFICICEKFKKQRDVLYDGITLCSFEFRCFSDEQKFIYMYLFKSEWKILARYLFEIWDLRGKQIYIQNMKQYLCIFI